MKLLIVGCERSGTTVISSLISEGSGLSYLNDPPDSWYIYPLVKMVGIKGFTLSLIYRLWKYSIVKIPGFATILSQLKIIHPFGFKVVYIVRDPRDTFAAIKERLELDLNGLYVNIHYLNKKGNSICENIGIKWSTYLKSAKSFEKKYPNDILFIKYEDFLNDKIEVLKTISTFASIKMNYTLIENKIDVQANKSWSSKIKGAKRYLNDLDQSEIDTIERITRKGIEEFNY